MKKNLFIPGLILVTFIQSCTTNNKTAFDIIQNTIAAIDTIETIYYKQDMVRTNPGKINDTIFRYREMYFKRLPGDSIVGVKGHWYMYVDDKTNIIFEDIYDGSRLIRKNNRDSVVKVYDLLKYPEYKRKHFWGHNTLFGMQYELRQILDIADSFSVERLNDTVFMDKDCFQILIVLENKITMPGFETRLEESNGSVSKTLYVIDKKTNYPIRMKGENYSTQSPEQRFFIDQEYYDIEFNPKIDEDFMFNTSIDTIEVSEIKEMKPY